MLVSQHLCNVVLTGVLGAPDLCSSSAADPGADRCFSTVTSTIDESVTLLRELVLEDTSLNREEVVVRSRKRKRQHGCTCPEPPRCLRCANEVCT